MSVDRCVTAKPRPGTSLHTGGERSQPRKMLPEPNWESLSAALFLHTSLLQQCQLRYRGSSLDFNTAPTWAVAPFGGQISVVSRALDCRCGGPSQPPALFQHSRRGLPRYSGWGAGPSSVLACTVGTMLRISGNLRSERSGLYGKVAQGKWRERENAVERVAARDNVSRGYREGWPVVREVMRNTRKPCPGLLLDLPIPAESTWSART